MFSFVLAALILTFVSAQTGLCPAPNGDFANPSSEQCTTFFRCIQGNPTLLRCPANQRFDFLFRICRQQGSVNCNNQLQVFTAPNLAAGLGGLNGLSGGSGGLGGLGGLAGGQIGAGVPGGGIINLLNQLGGANGDGPNGNDNLATLLVMSALMNRKAPGTVPQGQPPLPPAVAGPVVGYPSGPINPLSFSAASSTSQDSGITLLLPQNVQAQSLAGQGNAFYLGASQLSPYTSQATNDKLGQLQLENMQYQPLVTDNKTETQNATDSSNSTRQPPMEKNIQNGTPEATNISTTITQPLTDTTQKTKEFSTTVRQPLMDTIDSSHTSQFQIETDSSSTRRLQMDTFQDKAYNINTTRQPFSEARQNDTQSGTDSADTKHTLLEVGLSENTTYSPDPTAETLLLAAQNETNKAHDFSNGPEQLLMEDIPNLIRGITDAFNSN